MRIDGGVAIVTGASRGVGTYIAEALARKGVHLALAARSTEPLEATAVKTRALGVRALAVPTDVTDRAALRDLVATTVAELGAPDILVNNAGIEQLGHFASTDLDVIESTLMTNLVAVELLTRLVVPHMIERRRGHIVNISSLSGKTAYPYSSVYCSSKHGLVGFSWSLREELKPYDIGVSVICPTHIADVGVFAQRHPDNDAPALARPVRPEQVAQATVEAIERNRAEIIVARGLARWVDVFHALSPELTTLVARRGGSYDFLARDAAKTTPPP